MAYNNELAGKMVLDIETVALPDAGEFIEDVTAPANYKDPEKIAAYIAEARAEAVTRAALDPDLCRIVALGYQVEGSGLLAPTVRLCRTDHDEFGVLEEFWRTFRAFQFLGFNQVGFDLPVLLRRSLYLGVAAPRLLLGKYPNQHPQCLDLAGELSNYGARKYRSLGFYAKRLCLPALSGDGAEVAGWVAAGQWTALQQHNAADITTTVALATRLGHWR